MKRQHFQFFCFSLIQLLLFAGGGCAAKQDFFISHWFGPPETTPARIAEVAGANFTVTWLEGNPDSIKKGLDYCEANGIKAIVADPRIRAVNKGNADFEKNLDAVVNDYKNHPALWGYFVDDEPHAGKFPELAAINEYLLKRDPEHVPFMNLYPALAGPGGLGVPTYEEYVDRYLSTVKPKMLSYDHYVLFQEREGGDFYSNMEIIRKKALQYNVPFNYILLAVPHMAYRNPSEADLRWQINSALAYGAQGIMYFTYRTILGTQWDFHDAILDAEGKPTKKYEYAKKINGEVRRLGPILSRLRSTNVYHTKKLPAGAHGITPDYVVRAVRGGKFLIGEFRDERGNLNLMFVNRNPRKAADAKITFRRDILIEEADPNKGSFSRVSLEKQKGIPLWRVHFEPGQGRLIKVIE